MSENRPRVLVEYETPDGRSPFRDWLDGLKDGQARARIDARLIRLRLGLFGDCKSVGSGVEELRIDSGPGYRVYFGQDGARVVVLLIGGDKSRQAADIKAAKKYWAAYREE